MKALEGGNPFSVLRPARWSGLSGRVTDAGAQARRGTWAGPAGRAVHAWTTLLTCACLNPPGGGSEEEQHRWSPGVPGSAVPAQLSSAELVLLSFVFGRGSTTVSSDPDRSALGPFRVYRWPGVRGGSGTAPLQGLV